MIQRLEPRHVIWEPIVLLNNLVLSSPETQYQVEDVRERMGRTSALPELCYIDSRGILYQMIRGFIRAFGQFYITLHGLLLASITY